MAKKKKGGGSGLNSQHTQQINEVNTGLSNWNDLFGGWSGDAINYGQGNPFSQSAETYISNMLGGNAPNKWMDALYNDTQGVNLNESFGYLRDFLGPQGGGGGGGLNDRGGSVYGRSGGSGSSSRGGGRNVDIPDSSMGEGAFQDTAQWFLDRDERLDPANDPTLAPYVDAMRQEMEEAFNESNWAGQADAAGNNRWGGSNYNARMAGSHDTYMEDVANALSGVYMGSRRGALDDMKDIMGLGNQRDIAEGNIDAQLEAARMAASASRGGSADIAGAQRDATRLNAIGMLMGGAQFGMGMKGDMASLLQNGQMGALQAGQGYGELGMSGYDRAGNFGQLGLGALGALGNNINSYWNTVYGNQRANQARQDANARYQHNLPWQDAGRMVDLLRGLNDLSGDSYDMPYVPNPGQGDGGDSMNDWIAGLGSGFGSYFDNLGRY